MTTQDMTALGALGGRATAKTSKAKAAALKALHAAQRGVRQRPASPEREAILGEVHAAVATPARGRSVRALAAHLRKSDRTVRRWLSGEDWPTATHLRAMRSWLLGPVEGTPNGGRELLQSLLGGEGPESPCLGRVTRRSRAVAG